MPDGAEGYSFLTKSAKIKQLEQQVEQGASYSFLTKSAKIKLAAVKGAAVATGNTFHFYQTNNSPDPIDAREAARLARINAQRLGYELQGG